MRLLQKYYTDGISNYQGVYILMIQTGRLRFDWFTDCGEWFIYIYLGNKYYRFSSLGYLTGRR